jgi:hypothetical protein
MAFLAHFQVSAENALAADTDGIHAAANLGAAAQEITTGFTDPAVTRSVTITGNVSGIDGVVEIEGLNDFDEVISEELTANGVSTVESIKVYKKVTKVSLQIQDHTPAAQTETKQVTHGATSAGTITLTLTAAGYDGDPVEVEVEAEDTVTEVAGKIADALNAQDEFAAMFMASVTGESSDTVTLTAAAPAANDSTLSLAFADTDTTGVTMGSSTNGTAGVPYDKISVGWGDKLGLPYLLPHNTVQATYLNNVKEATAPTVTTDSDEIEKNTIDLNSALNGSAVDVYLFV